MSEMAPEGGGGHSFLMHKFLGVPAIFWLIGTVVLAYFFFRKNSSSAQAPPGATSGTGQESTGDITIQPPSTTIDVTAPYTNTQSSSVAQNPPRHATPNPQPTPPPPETQKKQQTPVKTPPKPAAPKGGTVTVGKWTAKNTPWNSTLSGIAAHEHVSVATLLKLNPQIKNPNVITPGEKIKY